MTILYFTATGNGLYVARSIGGQLVSIPKALKQERYHFSDDKIGLVFPIYGWGVPPMIREFLSKAKLDSEYVFAVMSYGMLHGAAASHLIALAEERGIRFCYINTIKMVDNYLPGFDMDKQKAGEPKKRIDLHLSAIASDIQGAKKHILRESFVERFISKRMWRADPYKVGAGVTDTFRVEDVCTRCGICARVCPVDNISVSDAMPTFSNRCVSCLACTHNCPQNAIRLTTEKSKTRFRNPHVALKDIIEANE